MGKRIRQQRRGAGGPGYRVRRQAFNIRIGYPREEGEGKIIRLFSKAAFSAPLALIKVNNAKFYNVAAKGLFEGGYIQIGKMAEIKTGNILPLEKIPAGTSVFNIEINQGDGGKLVRAGGSSAKISKKMQEGVVVMLPSKKEKMLPNEARATIGVIAGAGREEKPFVKAGNRWYLMKAIGKHYPLTSPIKMNRVAHPFGSGRGKRIKSKIAKRNAPPGKKVGLLRPRRVGRKKR